MSQSLAVALSQNPLVRAALVTTALFVFLGAATGALPVQCLATGVAACAAPTAHPAAIPAAIVPAPAPKAVAVTADLTSSEPPHLTLTNNEVVASTFALLNAGLQAPQSPTTLATTPPGSGTVPNASTGLQTRVVQTTVIHVSDLAPPPTAANQDAADPPSKVSTSSLLDPITPLAAPSAPPAAAASSAPVVTASVSPAQIAAPAKPKIVVAATVAPKAHTATITGQGANVRSAPTGGNNVMYALVGGTKVTVLGDQRGWYQVRDPKGRVGWVYSDFVSKA